MSASSGDLLSKIHCSYELPPASNLKTVEKTRNERRVRFPDDTVVSDYLEPFRPVPDNCTNEQLIAAYLESCLRYKVSPIEFLMDQLKGIDLSICNERYNRLSLRGIRLSCSQVESLEEVFRRVHFRELDFEGTYMDEQAATAFFDMLLHYETCQELNVTLALSRSQPSEAWVRCVTFLRQSDQLRRFTLSHTPLSVGNFRDICFFGLYLDCLSFRDCNLSGTALFGLIRWLRFLLTSTNTEHTNNCSSNSILRGRKRTSTSSRFRRRSKFIPRSQSTDSDSVHSIWRLKLDLAFNQLNSNDAETLLCLVRRHILVPQVQPSLNWGLADTTHSEQDSEETGCVDNVWHPFRGVGYLSDLDLSNNHLGNDGLRIICLGLLQSYRMRLRQLSMESLPVTGTEVNDDRSISCSSGDTQRDMESSGTSGYLCHCSRGLERLSVANNGLTAYGMQIVAAALMETPQRLAYLVGGLVSLDLSYNPGIGDEGVEILCEGLIRNRTLQDLGLRAVRMSFIGVFAISSFLSESKCLQSLDIRGNPLDLAALMALSKTMAINRTLVSFLSDARSLTLSEDPLVATDGELILFLIDEIGSCLRRNRSVGLSCADDLANKPVVSMSATQTSTVECETEPVNAPEPVNSTCLNKLEDDNVQCCLPSSTLKEVCFSPDSLENCPDNHRSFGSDVFTTFLASLSSDNPGTLEIDSLCDTHQFHSDLPSNEYPSTETLTSNMCNPNYSDFSSTKDSYHFTSHSCSEEVISCSGDSLPVAHHSTVPESDESGSDSFYNDLNFDAAANADGLPNFCDLSFPPEATSDSLMVSSIQETQFGPTLNPIHPVVWRTRKTVSQVKEKSNQAEAFSERLSKLST